MIPRCFSGPNNLKKEGLIGSGLEKASSIIGIHIYAVRETKKKDSLIFILAEMTEM